MQREPTKIRRSIHRRSRSRTVQMNLKAQEKHYTNPEVGENEKPSSIDREENFIKHIRKADKQEEFSVSQKICTREKAVNDISARSFGISLSM